MDANFDFQVKEFMKPRDWLSDIYHQKLMCGNFAMSTEQIHNVIIMIEIITKPNNEWEFSFSDFLMMIIEEDNDTIPAMVDIILNVGLNEENVSEGDKFYLSSREWAMPILKKYPFTISPTAISMQPWALTYLMENPIQINWNIISREKWAEPLMKMYPHCVNWREYPIEMWTSKNVSRWKSYMIASGMTNKEISLNVKKMKMMKREANQQNINKNNYMKAVAVVQRDYKYWAKMSGNIWSMPLLEANPEKVNWSILCEHEWALYLMKKHVDKVDWRVLSNQEWAMDLLKENVDKIKWDVISNNEWALPLIKENTDKVNWCILSAKHWAMDLLRDNPDKIDWDMLSTKSWALPLIKNNLNKANWRFLQHQQWAMPIIEKNLNRVDFDVVSRKSWAIDLIKKNIDKVNWSCIIYNSAAIDLIKENEQHARNELKRHGMDFNMEILLNPNAITYNYEMIKTKKAALNEELMMYVFSPAKIAQWIDGGFDVEDYMSF